MVTLVSQAGNCYSVRFINLESAQERRSSIERQLHAIGVTQFERFDAVDAALIDCSKLGYVRGRGPYFELSCGEIACFESHRRLWTEHDFQNQPNLVVLEDDVILSPLFRTVVESIIDSNLVYDVVKFDFNPQSKRYGPMVEIGPTSVRRLFDSSASSAGYLINARGAERLIRASREYCETLDSFLTSPFNDTIVFQIFPAIACQAMWLPIRPSSLDHIAGSSIDTPSSKKRAKGGLAFKLRRECRKLFHLKALIPNAFYKVPVSKEKIELTPDLVHFKGECTESTSE